MAWSMRMHSQSSSVQFLIVAMPCVGRAAGHGRGWMIGGAERGEEVPSSCAAPRKNARADRSGAPSDRSSGGARAAMQTDASLDNKYMYPNEGREGKKKRLGSCLTP
jgi:hypothetical protein